MRLPATPALSIDISGGGGISVLKSGSTNAIYKQGANGANYATQRPAINITQDCSETVADVQGRGNYYWNAVSAEYFVNNDTVYKAAYSAPLAANMSAGTEKVYFFEVGAYLVIIDTQNNEGWYIAAGASTTLIEITNVAFPPKQTPTLTLAKGGAVLNGTLYLLCTNGEIWSSAVENPTSWNILDFRNAETKPDPGVYMFEHTSHVVAVGTRTTEFFYDSSNATGSPVSPRTDIVPQVGAINHHSVWNDGEQVYFCSLNVSGDMNVMMMQGLQLAKISIPDLDSFLTQSIINDGIEIMGSGFSAGGKSFYILTLFNTTTYVEPILTITYDASNGIWGLWELAHTGINDFPLIGWTQATSTRAGSGMLTNGDLITVIDSGIPQDTTESSAYILAGYISPGYYATTTGDGANIPLEVITGQIDFGSRDYKHETNLQLVCKKTVASQSVSIQTSNEDNVSYNTAKTLDPNNPKQKLTRLGRFKSRNHKITYAGSEKFEIEAIEFDAS